MKKIAHFIAHSGVASIVASLLLLCAYWGASCGFDLSGEALADVADEVGWMRWLTPLGCFLMAYLAVKPTVEFSLATTRMPLVGTLFLMGCCIAPLSVCEPTHLALLALLSAACYLMLGTYRNRLAMGDYFVAFVLVGLATFVVPRLLWAAPLFVLCCYPLHSLHFRTFAAALLGLLTPYWVAFCLLYLTDNMPMIPAFADALSLAPPRYAVASEPVADVIIRYLPLVWVLLILLPGSISILSDSTLKLRSHSCYNYFMLLACVLLVVVALVPSLYAPLLPLLLLLVAYIGIPLFGDQMSRAGSIYLLVLTLLWAALLTLPLWMPFIPF